jgi:uncharacterized protein (DUF927 family)
MSAKIAEEKGRRAYAGQQVRMLDVPADAGRGYGAFDSAGLYGHPGKLADAIKQEAEAHYGTAGPEFVRRIVTEGPDEVAELVRDMIDSFKKSNLPADADGQVRRAADRFALIGAAGELASAWEIAPWVPGEAMAAAARAMFDWINARGGIEAAEVREQIAQVRLFIENHGESRFEPIERLSGGFERPVINRTGFRKGSGMERQWWVLPQAWKYDVCRGLDPTATARALAERGMLRRAKDGKFSRSETVDEKTMRVYVITAAILEGGEDE